MINACSNAACMWIDYWSQKMSSSLLLHFFNGKAKTQKTHIFAACLHLSQLFHILKHSNYLVRWSPATLDKLSVSELARHPAFTTIFPTIFPTIFVFALSWTVDRDKLPSQLENKSLSESACSRGSKPIPVWLP